MKDRAEIIAAIKAFFGYVGEAARDFQREWTRLGKTSRDQIIAGFANGSMTY
jgi:hypothetical protein